jgi:hypothetical protein
MGFSLRRGMQSAEELILIKAFLGAPRTITSIVVAIT